MESNNGKEVFSMTTTAQKWGNSIGVRIPQKLAKKYGVENGTEIQITEDGNHIILKPVNTKPTLDELLAECTPDKRHGEIDFGKPEGQEIW